MEQTRKIQRKWLIAVIAAGIVFILIGGIRYVENLRDKLSAQSIENVLTVTKQQQQAFDTFISGDRERLHSFALFFSREPHDTAEEVRRQLTMFGEVDAVYSVLCMDEGWLCSNATDDIRQLDKERLAYYRTLEGTGVRDSYTGLISGNQKFGYYETFTFANGHRGLVQKSYDRSKVIETFSLSFYNDQGFAYVVNQQGEILLRSLGSQSEGDNDNIFDMLAETPGRTEEIEKFEAALLAEETGSMFFSGDKGQLVYTYVPVENVTDWYLVSVVPTRAITAEAEEILQSSQMALVLLAIVIGGCGGFMLLIWNTHREIKSKDEKIDYQAQRFDIFATYLSRNTDDVYMMLDLSDNRLEYISPNAERVLGITPEAIAADLHVLETACVTDQKRDYGFLRDLAPGTALDPVESEWINPQTGEHKWFQQNIYGTQVQEQNKVVVYISDRTKERKAQENLTEALRIAQSANEAKSAFLSSISHDIRTPMNAIIGFLTLMRGEAENPAMVLEYTQRIETASQHLLGLINDVLDMNKIESGSATLNVTEINLAEIISEINAIIRPQANAKDQTFEIQASSLTFEHVLGDKLRINQILINLLSNAVKYTQKGGRIRMLVEEAPQMVDNYTRVRFVVADNGMGMSEEYQKVIFDPFTREDTAFSSQIQGTGLGMAITKSLVDLMGGSIAVESKQGEGSTFTVELELRIQEQEDDTDFWKHHGVSRMIVTDDEEDACKNIVRIMAPTGVVVDYATDGETAVKMMRAAREAGKPYDLILLDWKMPGLDGMETARLIRKNYSPKIPILLLTAYDWGDIEQEACEIGVDHFMPKPFFMSNFKTAIRRIMGGAKRGDEASDSVVENRKILVVDDIEVNRIILVKILTTMGARCEVAGDGKEAVEVFERSGPGEYDLILMDVQMPVMDGYEATRAIRSGSHPSAKDVAIIAMTANAFVDDVRDAINSGMDAHIAKPVQIDKLKATIQEVLDRREQAKKTLS